MNKIKSTETTKELRAAVLAEVQAAFAGDIIKPTDQTYRFARAGLPIETDEAMFVKVLAQATDWPVKNVIESCYGKFEHLHGANGLCRPEWQLLLRTAQSFTAWHPWHEARVGMSELAVRFASVNKCIRHIPSRLRRKIASELVSSQYECESEHAIYRICKSWADSEAAWQKWESNGGLAIDIQRFCRFIRGLRRRRTFLNPQVNTESEMMSVQSRLDRIRWTVADCPPNRHETSLPTVEREFAKRMYPVGKLLGIEIEFGCKVDSDLQEMEGEDYPAFPGVSWKTDSSVGSFENDGMAVAHRQEVNMLVNPDREAEWKKVDNTLAFLRQYGGRVNSTCGLHVHLDTRDLSISQYNTRARHLRTMFKVWGKYLVNKRRATNYFCNINGTDRYSAVNVYCRTEHNTVEIRIGHSTLNLHKVRLWCEFLRWARDAKKSEIVTFEGFMSSTCDPVVKAYLLSRIVRFAETWNEEIPNKLKTQLSASSDDICV